MPAPTKIVTLDPWLISAMNTRLGSAINGDEALDLAHQRISNRRRDSLTERPQKVPCTPVPSLPNYTLLPSSPLCYKINPNRSDNKFVSR